MPDLTTKADIGPCPLCGEQCEQTERGCACASCHYCLASSIENHNRLSEQAELWRLLEWAKTQPLLVRQQIDGTVDVLVLTGWGPHPNPAPTMDIVVWGCDSMLEALRDAQRRLEEVKK